MNCLLDTHTLIWALFMPQKLPSEMASVIDKKNNEIYVSAASIWEIAIKHSRRPDTLPCSEIDAIKACKDAGYHMLPISERHIALLPQFMNQKIHSDPFDHLLMAVSAAEQLVFLSSDENIQKYKGITIIDF